MVIVSLTDAILELGYDAYIAKRYAMPESDYQSNNKRVEEDAQSTESVKIL